MSTAGLQLAVTPKRVRKSYKKIALIQSRLEKVKAVGGTKIVGRDAVFIIKPCKSVHWGESMNVNGKGAKWYSYDALLVVTNLSVMKLAWFGQVGAKTIHDNVVNEVRKGKIRSIVDLYSLMSSHSQRYGAPVMLVETKLERYYD